MEEEKVTIDNNQESVEKASDQDSKAVQEEGETAPQVKSVNETPADEADSNMDDDKKEPKLSGKEEIQNIIGEFDETIQYMDFSFERAFQEKDNQFILAYREHIQKIQKEIDELREQSNESTYKRKKLEKIETLESKLSQIRK